MSELAKLDDYRAAPNERVVEKCERLLRLAKSGELQGLVVLYDGAGECEAGYTEVGVWDSTRAVYLAECWKHHRVLVGTEDDPT